MKLDQNLINDFIDLVNNTNTTKTKAKRYGTVYIDNGEYKVKIDGTEERLNFDSKSVYYESGERVNVDTSNNILNVTPILDKTIESIKKNNVKFGHDINSLNVKINTGSGGANGTASLVVSQGPKGDKGDTGEQGPKGDTGDTGPTGATGPKGKRGSNIYSTDESVTLDITTNETIIALGLTVNILLTTSQSLFGDADIAVGDYLLMNGALHYVGRISDTRIYMKPPIVLRSSDVIVDVNDEDIDDLF